MDPSWYGYFALFFPQWLWTSKSYWQAIKSLVLPPGIFFSNPCYDQLVWEALRQLGVNLINTGVIHAVALVIQINRTGGFDISNRLFDRRRRRGTRGNGRRIARGTSDLTRYRESSLKFTAVRLLSTTTRSVNAIRDVKLRLYQTARRDGFKLANGEVIQPDADEVIIVAAVTAAIEDALVSAELYECIAVEESTWVDSQIQDYTAKYGPMGSMMEMFLELEYKVRLYLGLGLPIIRE